MVVMAAGISSGAIEVISMDMLGGGEWLLGCGLVRKEKKKRRGWGGGGSFKSVDLIDG
jgi:hypothetical protein